MVKFREQLAVEFPTTNDTPTTQPLDVRFSEDCGRVGQKDCGNQRTRTPDLKWALLLKK